MYYEKQKFENYRQLVKQAEEREFKNDDDRKKELLKKLYAHKHREDKEKEI